MSSPITQRDRRVEMSDMAFDAPLVWATQVGRTLPLDEVDAAELARVEATVASGEQFNGRGLAVEEDFPDLRPRRLWSWLYFEAAHDIHRGALGRHTSTRCAAIQIGQAHAAGTLLREAARNLAGAHRRPDVVTDAEWDALQPAAEAARRP